MLLLARFQAQLCGNHHDCGRGAELEERISRFTEQDKTSGRGKAEPPPNHRLPVTRQHTQKRPKSFSTGEGLHLVNNTQRAGCGGLGLLNLRPVPAL